ncbi:MAG: MFS transporter [Terracidiphilus sp.]|nr:MFS transporter [Terracidiphilus sp.]
MQTGKTAANRLATLERNARRREFKGWHLATIVLLCVGYTGYYFCRSDLSVVMPLLIQDLGRHGIPADMAKIRLGTMVSASVLAYAVGKFLSGSMADLFGGRRNFLGGMGGAIVFTLIFAASGGLPLFTLAWLGNRLFQSAGWAGLVKVASRWFSYSSYGTAMGILCLSYLFGDAACRYIMSLLLDAGMGWRGIFVVGAAALGILFLVNWLFLRETPEERGLPAPEANPINVYAAEEENAGEKQLSLMAILRPLLGSFPFWLVCLLSLGTTLLRETFNFWTPTYFVQFVGLTGSQAASRSALFPLFGGLSVVASGILSDRLGVYGRNQVLFAGLALVSVCLLVLSGTPSTANPWVPVALVALTGFLLLGPYAYLSGAISLDFGGKRGSASAAGIIDGVGYLAGYLSGDTVARITVAFGWKNAFLCLAGVGLFSAAVALVLVIHQRFHKPGALEA